MCNIGTWLHTKFCGKLIGEDQFGNRYFESKRPKRAFERKERWVIYKGIDEPSKVPSQWFGWLHHQADDAPTSNALKHSWEKECIPNLTGTSYAYLPKGNPIRGTKRAKATGDYEAWKP